MSMAHSIESRVPLARHRGHRVRRHAAGADQDPRRAAKHVFKEARGRPAPGGILDRPKHGFGVPDRTLVPRWRCATCSPTRCCPAAPPPGPLPERTITAWCANTSRDARPYVTALAAGRAGTVAAAVCRCPRDRARGLICLRPGVDEQLVSQGRAGTVGPWRHAFSFPVNGWPPAPQLVAPRLLRPQPCRPPSRCRSCVPDQFLARWHRTTDARARPPTRPISASPCTSPASTAGHVAASRRAVADSVTEFPITSFKSAGTLRLAAAFRAWCSSSLAVLHTSDLYANVFALPLAFMPACRCGSEAGATSTQTRRHCSLPRSAAPMPSRIGSSPTARRRPRGCGERACERGASPAFRTASTSRPSSRPPTRSA